MKKTIIVIALLVGLYFGLKDQGVIPETTITSVENKVVETWNTVKTETQDFWNDLFPNDEIVVMEGS
ncbi:hypothetical protein KQ51_01380 [Candidatus Izimaplasma bacterium HR1]|jgi:hypothetical protein|uniref:hypothetical protein n=1 Tax=Candidatus Izimoplasma sp. HR1 TaxID=1541959 RepID=UPI0004F78307|nr:hypothetical protein KQ51_01380 [Candidatus Izimaplasma bacterium HR1]